MLAIGDTTVTMSWEFPLLTGGLTASQAPGMLAAMTSMTSGNAGRSRCRMPGRRWRTHRRSRPSAPGSGPASSPGRRPSAARRAAARRGRRGHRDATAGPGLLGAAGFGRHAWLGRRGPRRHRRPPDQSRAIPRCLLHPVGVKPTGRPASPPAHVRPDPGSGHRHNLGDSPSAV